MDGYNVQQRVQMINCFIKMCAMFVERYIAIIVLPGGLFAVLWINLSLIVLLKISQHPYVEETPDMPKISPLSVKVCVRI